MFSKEHLVNMALFLERVQCTGKEALAWTETYQAVLGAIAAIEAAPVNQRVADAVNQAVTAEQEKQAEKVRKAAEAAETKAPVEESAA